MYSYIFSTHPVNSRTHAPPLQKLRRASVKHPPGALPYKLPPFLCTRPENASQSFFPLLLQEIQPAFTFQNRDGVSVYIELRLKILIITPLQPSNNRPLLCETHVRSEKSYSKAHPISRLRTRNVFLLSIFTAISCLMTPVLYPKNNNFNLLR